VRLIWSTPATLDLVAIDRWLTTNAGPDTAESFLERVRQRARRLRDFPQIGVQVEANRRTVRVQRTPYLLVYIVRPQIVEILRVHHVRQDWRPPE